MSVTTTVQGADEVIRAMEHIVSKDVVKVLRTAVTKGSRIVAAKIRAAAPIGKTKRLRKSVSVRSPKRKRKGEAVAKLAKVRAPHAHLIEQGTKQRRTKSGANRGLVTPRPFSRRAFRAAQGEAVQKVEAEIKSGIDKAINAAATKGKT